MENGEKYTTSDSWLATYLVYMNQELLTIEFTNGWGAFVFRQTPELNFIVSEFLSYQGSVVPRVYTTKYRGILRALREAKELNKHNAT